LESQTFNFTNTSSVVSTIGIAVINVITLTIGLIAALRVITINWTTITIVIIITVTTRFIIVATEVIDLD